MVTPAIKPAAYVINLDSTGTFFTAAVFSNATVLSDVAEFSAAGIEAELATGTAITTVTSDIVSMFQNSGITISPAASSRQTLRQAGPSPTGQRSTSSTSTVTTCWHCGPVARPLRR